MQEQPPSDPPRREPAAKAPRSRSPRPTFTPPPTPEPAPDVAGDAPPPPRRVKAAPIVLFQPPDPAQTMPPAADGPAAPRPRPPAEVAAGTDPGTPTVAPPPGAAAADVPVIEEAPKRPRRAPAAKKATPAKKAAPAKKATSTARKPAVAVEAPNAPETAVPADTETPETTTAGPGAAEPAEAAPGTAAPTPAGRARKTKGTPAKKTAPPKRTPARRASAAPTEIQSEAGAPALAQGTTEPAQVPTEPAAAPVPAEPTAAQVPPEPAVAQAEPATAEPATAQVAAESVAGQASTEPAAAQVDQPEPQANDEPAATAAGEIVPVLTAQVSPQAEKHGWRAVAARVLDHPGFAPEPLALAAVDALGPRAADWVERTRDAYPDADADGLARLVTRRFVRLAGTGGALAAGAGLFAPVAELTAVLWTQANLVLHLAAVYGRDPAHPDRVADLLVLTQVHPDAGTARAALDAARSAGAPAEGPWSRAAEGAWRLTTPLVAQAAGWLGLRLAARLLPGAAALAAATGDAAATERLAARAITLYRPHRA
ncbi:hypothetical protein AB0F68_00255 [Micromonospora sp. NPDC023966]|uniref:hypothetical protein n=1 Tax=Micromonospora sp. NPDC023966 TaxID=3154699 RepID=UPI00340F445F